MEENFISHLLPLVHPQLFFSLVLSGAIGIVHVLIFLLPLFFFRSKKIPLRTFRHLYGIKRRWVSQCVFKYLKRHERNDSYDGLAAHLVRVFPPSCASFEKFSPLRVVVIKMFDGKSM